MCCLFGFKRAVLAVSSGARIAFAGKTGLLPPRARNTMAPVALVIGLGYIGSAVISALSRAGYVVHATARSTAGRDAWLANAARLGFTADVKMHVVPEVTVPGALDSILHGVSVVVHCAALAPIPWRVTKTPPADHFERSLRYSTAATLEPMRSAAISASVKRFVLLSTAATTGSSGPRDDRHWRPITEEQFLRKRDMSSLYGAPAHLPSLTAQSTRRPSARRRPGTTSSARSQRSTSSPSTRPTASARTG